MTSQPKITENFTVTSCNLCPQNMWGLKSTKTQKNRQGASSSTTKIAEVLVTYWNQRALNSWLEHMLHNIFRNLWISINKFISYNRKQHTHTPYFEYVWREKNHSISQSIPCHEGSRWIFLGLHWFWEYRPFKRWRFGKACFKAQDAHMGLNLFPRKCPKKIPKDPERQRQKYYIRVSAPRLKARNTVEIEHRFFFPSWETNRISLKSLQRHHLKQDHCQLPLICFLTRTHSRIVTYNTWFQPKLRCRGFITRKSMRLWTSIFLGYRCNVDPGNP